MLRPGAISPAPALALAMVLVVALVPSTSSALGGPTLSTATAERAADRRVGGRGVVAVVRSTEADDTCREVVTRIIAELMADNVPVIVLTCAAADPSCLGISGVRPSAVVVVHRHENICGVAVRPGDGSESGRTDPLVAASGGAGHARRIARVDSSGAPAALAIRTVELLKVLTSESGEEADASPETDARDEPLRAAEVDPDSPSESVTAKPIPAQSVAPVGPHNITIDAGAAIMGGFASLKAAYGPSISFSRRTADHVSMSLVLGGPAFASDQSNGAGIASVRHEMALLETHLHGLFWDSLVLRAGLGAGVYYIHVDAKGNGTFDPMTGAALPGVRGSAGGFAWLLSWSAGVVANVSPAVGVFLDWRMLVLAPTPVVLLNGLEIGRVGNPGTAISSGVELRF